MIPKLTTVEPRFNEGARGGQICSYNEVSLYRGSFPYIVLLLGSGKSLVLPRTSLYRGSLNRGSTVNHFYKQTFYQYI